VSAITNFILNPPGLQKNARSIHLIIIGAYMLVFFYIEKHVAERFITTNERGKTTIPLYKAILETGAMAIAFWYNYICFKEVKRMWKKEYRDY
jgi:hypothetical protein